MKPKALSVLIGLGGCSLIAWGWVPAFAQDARGPEVLYAWTEIFIGLAMVLYAILNLRPSRRNTK